MNSKMQEMPDQMPGWLQKLDDPWGISWRVVTLNKRADWRRSRRLLRALVRGVHYERPVFVIGVPRSGTTMLFHLLLYGLSSTVVRPSNPYGPRQNPASNQGAISVFLGRIAQGLPINIWGRRRNRARLLSRRGFSSGLRSAATSTGANPIYNIGSGQGTSLHQLVEIIETVVEEAVKVERLPSRAFDVKRAVLDVEKARNELAWTPKISLQQGVSQTWRWIRDLSSPTKTL